MISVELIVGHKSTVRDAKTADGCSHDWEVYVRGANNNIESFVERVIFNVDSVSNPKRVVKSPPYVVRDVGYVNMIQLIDIEIFFKNNETKSFSYDFYMQSFGPSKACKVETLIFNKPSVDLTKMILGLGKPTLDKSGSSSPVVKKMDPKGPEIVQSEKEPENSEIEDKEPEPIQNGIIEVVEDEIEKLIPPPDDYNPKPLPKPDISLEEFRWNLLLICHNRFPVGLYLDDISSEYYRLSGQMVTPDVFIKDAEEWNVVFEKTSLSKFFVVKPYRIHYDVYYCILPTVSRNNNEMAEIWTQCSYKTVSSYRKNMLGLFQLSKYDPQFKLGEYTIDPDALRPCEIQRLVYPELSSSRGSGIVQATHNTAGTSNLTNMPQQFPSTAPPAQKDGPNEPKGVVFSSITQNMSNISKIIFDHVTKKGQEQKEKEKEPSKRVDVPKVPSVVDKSIPAHSSTPNVDQSGSEAIPLGWKPPEKEKEVPKRVERLKNVPEVPPMPKPVHTSTPNPVSNTIPLPWKPTQTKANLVTTPVTSRKRPHSPIPSPIVNESQVDGVVPSPAPNPKKTKKGPLLKPPTFILPPKETQSQLQENNILSKAMPGVVESSKEISKEPEATLPKTLRIQPILKLRTEDIINGRAAPEDLKGKSESSKVTTSSKQAQLSKESEKGDKRADNVSPDGGRRKKEKDGFDKIEKILNSKQFIDAISQYTDRLTILKNDVKIKGDILTFKKALPNFSKNFLLPPPALHSSVLVSDFITIVANFIVNEEVYLKMEEWETRRSAAKVLDYLLMEKFKKETANDYVVRVFSKPLKRSESLCLPSVFGSVCGLGHFGPEMIKSMLMPLMKGLGRVLPKSKGVKMDKETVKKIIMIFTTREMYKTWSPNDFTIQNLIKHFGEYFATYLYISMMSDLQQGSKKFSKGGFDGIIESRTISLQSFVKYIKFEDEIESSNFVPYRYLTKADLEQIAKYPEEWLAMTCNNPNDQPKFLIKEKGKNTQMLERWGNNWIWKNYVPKITPLDITIPEDHFVLVDFTNQVNRETGSHVFQLFDYISIQQPAYVNLPFKLRNIVLADFDFASKKDMNIDLKEVLTVSDLCRRILKGLEWDNVELETPLMPSNGPKKGLPFSGVFFVKAGSNSNFPSETRLLWNNKDDLRKLRAFIEANSDSTEETILGRLIEIIGEREDDMEERLSWLEGPSPNPTNVNKPSVECIVIDD